MSDSLQIPEWYLTRHPNQKLYSVENAVRPGGLGTRLTRDYILGAILILISSSRIKTVSLHSKKWSCEENVANLEDLFCNSPDYVPCDCKP